MDEIGEPPSAMDSDGSQWDTSLKLRALQSEYRIINKWYLQWQVPNEGETKEEFKIRQKRECTIREGIIRDAGPDKIIKVIDTLLQCLYKRGHISGFFLTALANCLVGRVLHSYFFLWTMKELRRRWKANITECIDWYATTFEVHPIDAHEALKKLLE